MALGAVAAGIAAPLLRHRLRLPRPLVSALTWQAPLSFALATADRRGSRARDAGIYALQMWAYTLHYKLPADDPEAIRDRLRVGYPIRADRALWRNGEVPTVALQRALGRPGEVRRHDAALTWVHWSWFVVPHGAVGYVLLRRRPAFRRSAALMAAVFDAGLVFYWTLPTAPPWWAGGNGDLPPVRRIMVEVGERRWGRLWRPLYDLFGGNPLAAMPSLHFATSVMAAHVLSDVGRGPGALGWAYTGALGFSLVYLGEHYVVDLAAGLALAEAVRRLEPAVAPGAALAAGALRRLEGRMVG